MNRLGEGARYLCVCGCRPQADSSKEEDTMVIPGRKNGEVTFVCRMDPEPGKVYLVGDFNRWDPTKKRMVRARDGSFRARLTLPPGRYEYKFVVDGVWVEDPSAPRCVENRHGTFNSVAEVA
jgi:1,4-alpha-glucan branching enzyme